MLTRREILFGAAAAAVARHRQSTAAQAGVSFLMPIGATDCHAHIFCDQKAFPMSGGRSATRPIRRRFPSTSHSRGGCTSSAWC